MIFTTKWRNQSHLILHIVCRNAKRIEQIKPTNINLLFIGRAKVEYMGTLEEVWNGGLLSLSGIGVAALLFKPFTDWCTRCKWRQICSDFFITTFLGNVRRALDWRAFSVDFVLVVLGIAGLFVTTQVPFFERKLLWTIRLEFLKVVAPVIRAEHKPNHFSIRIQFGRVSPGLKNNFTLHENTPHFQSVISRGPFKSTTAPSGIGSSTGIVLSALPAFGLGSVGTCQTRPQSAHDWRSTWSSISAYYSKHHLAVPSRSNWSQNTENTL